MNYQPSIVARVLPNNPSHLDWRLLLAHNQMFDRMSKSVEQSMKGQRNSNLLYSNAFLKKEI